MDVQYCAGCEDNFYNGNNPYGVQECWHRKDAVRVARVIIGIDEHPPYHHKPALMPECYRKKRHVLVRPDAITAEGYWR